MKQAQSGRPRILEVLFSFRVGGSEIVGLELAHGLSRTGLDVMCSTIDGMSGPLRQRCADFGLPVVDLGLPARGVLARNGISARLVRTIRALRLDAMHVHHFVAHNKLSLAAHLAGVPNIVVTEHSDADLRGSLAGRLRLRANSRLATGISVIHEGLKHYLVRDIGMDPAQICVIPNGIDLGHWHGNDRLERRSALNLQNEYTFVYVGRLVSVKNVPQLIHAYLAAQQLASAPWRLIIVGDGPEMHECRAAANSAPAGKTIAFAGEQHDTRAFLAAADAFVLNSHSEGTPRALLEAMCVGLPAICPSVGGIPALLNGNGWLTDPKRPSTLVDALLAAAADPANSAELGRKGRAFVASQYSADAIVTRYRDLLLNSRRIAQ